MVRRDLPAPIASNPNVSARATTRESSSNPQLEIGQIIQAWSALSSTTLRCFQGHAINHIAGLSLLPLCKRTCLVRSSPACMAATTSHTSTRAQAQGLQIPNKVSLKGTPTIHMSRLISSRCRLLFINSRSNRQTTKYITTLQPLHIFRRLRQCTQVHKHNLDTIRTAPTKRPFNIPRVHHIHPFRSHTTTNPTSRPQFLSLRQSTHKPIDLIASKPKVLIGIIPVYPLEATNTPITQKHRQGCKDMRVTRKPLCTLYKDLRQTSARLEILTTQQFLTLTSVMQVILLFRCLFMI